LQSDIPILVLKGLGVAVAEESLEVVVVDGYLMVVMTAGSLAMVDIDMDAGSNIWPLG
jgi:hypothetical protein